MYRNHEGYSDPTAGVAVDRIYFEECLEKEKAEKARREAARKRRAEARKKARLARQNVPIHWVKAWPKEKPKGTDKNTGVKK